MVIGIHSRDNDLVVNAVRGKQLTNFRVSGKEDAIKITPPIQLTLEYAVGVHRRRRAGRDHAEVDPHPEAVTSRNMTASGRRERPLSGLPRRFAR